MKTTRLAFFGLVLGWSIVGVACSSSTDRRVSDAGGRRDAGAGDGSVGLDASGRDAAAPVDASARDAGPPDAGRDAGTDAGTDAGVRCTTGLTNCGGVCRNLRTDPANCGMCDHACAGSEMCSASTCTLSCTSPLIACGSTCVNLLNDPANCGMCGHACGPSMSCMLARCTIPCPAGLTDCAGTCVDLTSDDANCGSCGRVCPAMRECNSSVCTIVCGAGLTACGASCIDTTSDPRNCGRCGHLCRGGATCMASACVGGTPGFTGETGMMWETVPPNMSGIRGLMAWVPAGYPTLYLGTGGSFGSYDLATMTWATLVGPPGGTSLAGWGSPALSNDDIWEILPGTGNIVRYDPMAGAWSIVRSGITGGDNQSMTVADGLGNLWAYNGMSQLVQYDPVADAVTYFDAPTTSPFETRVGYDADTNSIYYGGFASPTLSRFDIATSTVTTLTPIPEAGLNDIFCADHTGHLYAAGDFSGMTMWQYTIATDTWARIPDYPMDHGDNGSCAVSEDGWLYVEPGSTTTIYRLQLL